MAVDITYSMHKLSHLISIEALVTADYMRGTHVGRFPHSHENAWELIYCMNNTMKAFDGASALELKQGDAIFIRPGTIHDILIESEETIAFIVSFTCSNSDLLMPFEDRIIYTDEEQQRLFHKMRGELEAAFIRNPGNLHLYSFEPSVASPLGAEQMICCYLEQLLILMLRDITRKGGAIPKTSEIRNIMQDYLIDRVNNYIRAHYDEPLTVGRIAEQFHYSRTRFSTIYKELTGTGVNEMISDVRIECAKELLLRGEFSVAEVAEHAGFSSPQYFSHKFTEKVGMSPTQFAAKNVQKET